MTVLAYGSMPNDFTGWGGTGSPSYTQSITVSNTAGYWLFTRMMGSLAIGSNGFGRGCLWLPWSESANTFSVLTKQGFQGSSTGSTTDTAAVVIHNKTMTAWIVLRIGFSTINNTTFAWYLTTDLTDSAKYTNISNGVFTTTSGASTTVSVIDVQGAGTVNGKINFYADITEGYPPGTVAGTSWSGDLTDYADFNAVSFHAPGSTSSTLVNVVCAQVSTESLRGCRITEVAEATAGTYAEWTGTLSQSATSPVNYSAYGSGLYAYAVGNRKTFAASDETSMPTSGYELRSVQLSATLTGGMRTTTQVSAYVYNPTAKTSATGSTTYTCSSDGGIMKQVWETDPITGTYWTRADFAAYEFGVIRVE